MLIILLFLIFRWQRRHKSSHAFLINSFLINSTPIIHIKISPSTSKSRQQFLILLMHSYMFIPQNFLKKTLLKSSCILCCFISIFAICCAVRIESSWCQVHCSFSRRHSCKRVYTCIHICSRSSLIFKPMSCCWLYPCIWSRFDQFNRLFWSQSIYKFV